MFRNFEKIASVSRVFKLRESLVHQIWKHYRSKCVCVCVCKCFEETLPAPLADKFCLLVWIRVIAYDMHMFCFKDKLILSQEVSYFWAKRINYDSWYPWLLPGVLEHLVIWGMFLGFLLRGAISEVCMCVRQWDNFLCGSICAFWFSAFDSHDPVILWILLMKVVHLTRWNVHICHWWSMIFNI